MKQVKNVCKHCGKAEEYTTAQRFFLIVRNCVMSFLLMGGVLFIVYLILVSPTKVANDFADANFNRQLQINDPDIRKLAINLTHPCSGDDAYCFARQLYENTKHIRYIGDSDYTIDWDVMYVYENGGNCRHTSKMYASMLRSVGVNARMECSIEFKHCVTVVDNFRNNQQRQGRWVVDLTVPIIVEITDEQDTWDYVRDINSVKVVTVE